MKTAIKMKLTPGDMERARSTGISVQSQSLLIKQDMVLNTLLDELIDEIESCESNDCLFQEGLFTGMAGLAYYYYHLFKLTSNERYIHKSAAKIRSVLALIGMEDQLITYYTNFSFGLSGFAFVINEFKPKKKLPYSLLSVTKDIDELIYQSMLRQIGHGHYSLLFGFSGSLFYFNSKNGNDSRNRISSFLSQLVKETRFSDQDSLSDYFRKIFRSAFGSVNFSILHGIGGLFYVLFLIAVKHPAIDEKFKIKAITRDFLNLILEKFVSSEPFFNLFSSNQAATNQIKNDERQISAHINDLYLILFFARYSSFYSDQYFKPDLQKQLVILINNNKVIQITLVKRNAFEESATITELFGTLNKYIEIPEASIIQQSMIQVTQKCLISLNHSELNWNKKLALVKGYPSAILSQLASQYPEKSSGWNKILFL